MGRTAFSRRVQLDPGGALDAVVNLQGDLPTLDPRLVRACLAALDDGDADIGTIAAEITSEEERTDPNVVKVVGLRLAPARLRALYFTRATAPYGDGPLITISASTPIDARRLEHFVSLPSSALETA